MRPIVLLLFTTFVLNIVTPSVSIALEAINTYGVGGGFFSDPPRTDVAIKGYDTVAYFKVKKPVLGSDVFVTTWKGAKWKFSSSENLAAFKENPEKYAPQFGGYCAYGIAQGYAVKIEPDQWTIVDGKLYLNYDADVSKKWNKDQIKFINEAKEKFESVLKK